MNTRKQFFLLLSCLLCVGCANVPRVGDPGSGWRFLGELPYKNKDRDRKVQVGAGAGEFTHVQLRVKKVGMRLKTVRVTFSNGDTWEPTTRLVIPGGGWTRDMSIPNAPRRIQSILVRGRAVGVGTQNRVRVYARPTKGSRRGRERDR